MVGVVVSVGVGGISVARMMVVGGRNIILFFSEIYGSGATVASHVGTHHAIGIVSFKQILFNCYIVAPL